MTTGKIQFTMCMSFVSVCQFLCVLLSTSGLEAGMWDLNVLIPDHCLSVLLYYSGKQCRL